MDLSVNDTGTAAVQLPTPAGSPSPDLFPSNEGMPDTLRLSQSVGGVVLLQSFPTANNGMHFQTFQAANSVINAAHWSPPSPDSTIPTTVEHDRLVVDHLVDAFFDLNSATDTKGNAYRKRFTPGLQVSYDPWAVENCAWHVLREVKSLHINGFKAPIFDSGILECIGQTADWTFAKRIHAICLVLKISKSIAVTLMKWEKTWTIIGAPHKLYSSTLVNTQSNAKRNLWVKVGRQADPNHVAAPAFSIPSAPLTRPIKRKKTATSPLATSGAAAAYQSPSTIPGPFGVFRASPTSSSASTSTSLSTYSTPSPTIANNDVQMVDITNNNDTAEVEVKTERETDNDVSTADTDNVNITSTLATQARFTQVAQAPSAQVAQAPSTRVAQAPPSPPPSQAAQAAQAAHTSRDFEAAEIMAFLRGDVNSIRP